MRRAYRPEPQDLVLCAVCAIFAVASFIWPDTGYFRLGGLSFARGYAMALAFMAIVVAAAAAGFTRPSTQGSSLSPSFVRLFYPQMAFLIIFSESILLSTRAMGGRSHDAFFAAADQWIFGFQPSRTFYGTFGSLPWFNELMFGSYFLYYIVIICTPWIAWFLGRREEARRQLFIAFSAMGLATIFYILFRVQGPKYYFEDLRSAWYDGIAGGPFVSFFQGVFSSAVLSGAAFPSTHVALTAVSVAGAARIDRRLLPFYILCAFLISASTVYIYAHYAVDVLGGLAYALIAIPLFDRLYSRALGISETLARALGPRGAPLRLEAGESLHAERKKDEISDESRDDADEAAGL